MIETELIIRPTEFLRKELILSLRGTKALNVAIPALDKYTTVTTWSALVRKVISWLEPTLTTIMRVKGEEVFVDKYVQIFNRRLDASGIRLNSNCPIGVFKDNEIDEFISSSVYLNNQNHNLKLFDYEGHSWNVCAVYTGEIVLVLSVLLEMVDEFRCNNALIAGNMDQIEPLVIQITYMNRTPEEEASDMMNDLIIKGIDSSINGHTDLGNLERTLIENALQFKGLILSLYNVATSLNLKSAQNVIEGIYTKDLVKTLQQLKSDIEK